MAEYIKNYLLDLATDKIKSPLALVIKSILYLLSLLYGLGLIVMYCLLKLGLIKQKNAGCKVVSIGNITWGGTGKTPAVAYVVNILKGTGRKVAILSRGHAPGQITTDETAFLAEEFPGTPILTGRDRVKTAEEAVNSHEADYVVLDDGFQHWRLKRDLDIVLIDGFNPFGNKRLIPSGILREPLSGLKRADIILLTKTDRLPELAVNGLKQQVARINRDAVIACSVHQPIKLVDLDSGADLGLDFLRHKRACMVSAIGDADYFLKTLQDLGASIEERFSFIDHHVYTDGDFNRILQKCRDKKLDIIVTTSKDATKISLLVEKMRVNNKAKVVVVKIGLRITENEEKLKALL